MTGAPEALARSENLVALERWKDALSSLGAALADDATASRALCLKAQCHLGLQENKAALEAGRQALSRDPMDEWPHRIVAIAQLRLRDTKAALREAREAVRLDPDSAHTLHILAIAQLAGRQAREASETAAASVATNPMSPLAHATAGLVAARRRQWDEAASAYREALRLDPSDSDAALALGRVLHRRGDKAGAAEAYLAAGRSDPTNRAARHGLARLGVPVLGGGTLFAVKLVAIGGARYAIVDLRRPVTVALVAAGALAIGCSVMTYLRIRATRALPEHLRRSLAVDHRDYVLSWVATSGLIASGLGISALFVPASRGGGTVAAIVLIAIGIGGLVLAERESSRGAHGLVGALRRVRLPALARR